MNDARRRTSIIISAVAIMVILIAGMVLAKQDEGDSSTAEQNSSREGEQGQAITDPREAEEEVGFARRDPDAVTAMGDEDADLVLIEYSDYRCPFCGAFARDTFPTLKEEYIDTGKLRFEWRDFPVFGPESVDGAMAARAAGEQDLYWEYHDVMYQDAPQRGHLKITDEKVMDWAKEVGVPDLEQFEKDLENRELRAKVDADAKEARQVGATGTPTFVIGQDLIVGAQPTEAFREAIDEQLKALEDS